MTLHRSQFAFAVLQHLGKITHSFHSLIFQKVVERFPGLWEKAVGLGGHFSPSGDMAYKVRGPGNMHYVRQRGYVFLLSVLMLVSQYCHSVMTSCPCESKGRGPRRYSKGLGPKAKKPFLHVICLINEVHFYRLLP